MDFLFLGALIGLPLAALPVVLHLLFRRKSPVVLFSTTRFIRTSMQRTAARRRIQKWLLLAARMLVVLLLIFIAAQPAKRLAAELGTGGSGIAAIVVDTSYSMLLSKDQQTLLDRADQTIVGLLQNELAGADVAIFQSLPDSSSEHLQSAGERLAKWTPLKPQSSPQPLADRIAQATKMLDAQQAGTKWLIVLTDAQSREFPRALESWTAGNFVVFDLHPSVARSAGVTKLSLDPDQPIPGVGVEIVSRITGRAGDARAVSMEIDSLDGKRLATTSPRVVRTDSGTESELRLPFKLPAEPYLLIRAGVDGDDDLPWDNTRQIVVTTPPPRRVKVLTPATPSAADRFITLALDPNEGRAPDWPLRVGAGRTIAGDDAVIVALLSAWPTVDQVNQFQQAANRGATLVLFLRPGLQETWDKQPAAQRDAIRPLLPGDPVLDPGADRVHRAAPPAAAGTFLRELLDERFQLGAMTINRLVPFNRHSQSTTLLSAAPKGDGSPAGLLYRHRLGAGTVYTFATLPDPQFSTLATHPIFLPMLVRCCLPDAASSAAQNVELGAPLKMLDANETKLTLITPAGESFVVDRAGGTNEFVFDRAVEPGVYRWTNPAGNVVGAACVQFPSAEAVLAYRDVPAVIPGDNVIVSSNLDDFRVRVAGLTRPSPRWSPLIAGVLLLLCAEAILGNSSRLWKMSRADRIQASRDGDLETTGVVA